MPEPSNTYPGSISMLSGETLLLGSDFSVNIEAGQNPSLPTAILYDITDGEPGDVVPQAGDVTLDGNIVSKSITGLTALHTYRLILGLTAAPGIVWQAAYAVECPY